MVFKIFGIGHEKNWKHFINFCSRFELGLCEKYPEQLGTFEVSRRIKNSAFDKLQNYIQTCINNPF